ncbi:MAG TPA: S53 family peptidase [Streptosporangiaceae bacterium]|jgi:subtilase family serine protease
MHTMYRKCRLALAGLAAIATMTAAAATVTAPASAAATPGPASLAPAAPCRGGGQKLSAHPPAPQPGHVALLWRLARGARLSCYPGQHATPDSIGEPGGYDPAELQAYLGLHGDGAGQTVAVTIPYDVNEAQAVTTALSVYDSWYGLPPACSATITTGCFPLTFAAPHGTAPPPQGLFEALLAQPEAELDVELIHALVPRASIEVVEGYDDTVTHMLQAVAYAQSLHPAAVSNSWGTPEFSGEQAAGGHCTATGSPCVFATGDSGNYGWCDGQGTGTGEDCGGYPAASPKVLAVGGTTLDLTDSGKKVQSETAWSGSGGGISAYEPFPAYQQRADSYTTGRGVPDVSFDADPNSGIAVYDDQVVTYNGQTVQAHEGWVETGGTSAGAPAWSAILAAADQLRAAAGQPQLTIGQIHAAAYAKSRKKPVADITTGTNGLCGAQCTAGPGYDLVTGEGSPRHGIDTYLASR